MLEDKGIYFKSKKRHFCYFSKIGNLLYFKDFMKESFHVKTQEGIHLVTKDPCLAHNFSPYLIDGQYITLAGQDRWKMNPKWRGLGYYEFKKVFKDHFGKKYTKGPTAYKGVQQRFTNTVSSQFSNGLYLVTSPDGVNWATQSKIPVITVENEGFNSSLSWKSGEFDSKLCIIKRNGLYWLYLRDNIGVDRRSLQYATSPDLITWSEFNPVNMPFDIDFDNYYHMEAFNFNGKVFAFAPFYTDFYCCIRLLMSDDGVNFTTVSDLFQDFPVNVQYGKRKNKDHMVGGIEFDDDNIIFYVHHNYLGYTSAEDVTVNKYHLPKRYLEAL